MVPIVSEKLHMLLIFVFVTIYLIVIAEQCYQRQNMRHENSHKFAIKKNVLLLKYFRRKSINFFLQDCLDGAISRKTLFAHHYT